MDTQILTPVPEALSYHPMPAVAGDADFKARWAAWLERGSVHELRARRRFAVRVGLFSLAAAIVFAYFKS